MENLFFSGKSINRLFDAFVIATAAGTQPSLDYIEPVGYLMRTTPFMARKV